jgi:hypothetical protein
LTRIKAAESCALFIAQIGFGDSCSGRALGGNWVGKQSAKSCIGSGQKTWLSMVKELAAPVRRQCT